MHLPPRIDHIEQCASHPVNVIFWSDGTTGEFPSLPKVNASKNAMVKRRSLSKISRWVDSERPFSLDGLGFPAYVDGAAEDYRTTLVKGLVMEVWMAS